MDKAKELKLDKEISEKLGAVDEILKKAKEMRVITTGNRHLQAFGQQKESVIPKPQSGKPY